MTTLLLSLNMTRLGSVQARISFGEKRLLVGIVASENEALAALRGQIGQLRQGLLAEGLPLHALELAHMGREQMRQERQGMLGLGAGFSASV
ncbi:MAG: flagellar hook-length control protein FliK [Magnetococcus sp. DMHC-6]